MIYSAYALVLNDSSAIKSTSGGGFIAITQKFFEKHDKTVVYGVTLYGGKKIQYERATSFEECAKFQGSKYVESSIGDQISLISDDLNTGHSVLVSGLPCQIFALKKKLELDNVCTDNLITIDIMCHGAARKSVWNDYVAWLENIYRSEVKDYSFRYKPAKWKNYPSMVALKNGKKIVNSQEVRIFNKLFLSGYIMRNSCYQCQFANTDRPGDFTLADFWGIKQVLPKFPQHENVSLILTNSTKAEEILKLLTSEKNILFQKCENDDYIKYQHNLTFATPKPAKWEEFQVDYDKHGLIFCVKKYAKYNLKGKIVFSIKKLLNEIGVVSAVRRHVR